MQKPQGPHPLALLYPKRNPVKRQQLKRSLATIGQQHPIVVHKGRIIDGVQRNELCEELGLPVKSKAYEGDGSDAAILQYIIASNGERSLSDSQSAMIAAESLPHAGKDVTIEQVAEMFGVGRAYVVRANTILRRSPAVARRIKTGELTVSKALRQLDRKQKSREWRECDVLPLNKATCSILTGESRERLASLPSGSADLVACDPPYGINDSYHDFDDAISLSDLIGIIEPVMRECVRVLKSTGAVWMIMSSRYAVPTAMMLERLGLHRQEMVIWAESFGPHNSKFHTDCYRVIHFYSKHPTDFTFNFNDVRTYIPSWRIENADDRADADGKLPSNVWGVWTDKKVPRVVDNSPERIPDKDIKVPNQVPVRLMDRIVLLSSNEGETVLDPFHGTGTTAVAALLRGRKYVGCELSPVVAERSPRWIKARLELFKKLEAM